MKKQPLVISITILSVAILFSHFLSAQTMNRVQMYNNIITNVYQNPNHAITGQTLQNVLLNQNYSYNNLKTDTDFVSVFDTGYTYFKGMSVLSGVDTIYRCAVPTHHGPWNASDFRFTGLIGLGGGSGIFGGGSVPYLPVFIANNTVGNSHIIDGGGNQQMLDNSSIISVDWLNRNLYSSNATTYLTWGNGTLPSAPTDIISKGYADATYSGGTSSIGGTPYVPVFTANNIIGNSHIIDGGGSQQMLDKLSVVSIDWLNRNLYSSNGSTYLSWGNGTSPSAPTDIISKGYADVNYAGGTSSTGSAPYVAVFTANHIVGNSHIIDGSQQQMIDNLAVISLDWLNRKLYSSNATTYLTWGNGASPSAPSDILSKGYADATYTGIIGSTSGIHSFPAPIPLRAETWLGANAGGGGAPYANTTYIGYHSGDGASDAYYSTFLGSYAGYQAVNSFNAIYIGDSAGYSDRLSSINGWAILIGPRTNTGGYDNSIVLGGYTTNTSSNQLYVADNITNFHLAGNSYHLPTVGGTFALVNYHFDIQRVVNYNIPVSDFDGQTVVELTGGPGCTAVMPDPASVPAGVPVIIKVTGLSTPGPTALQIQPFGTETIDNWPNLAYNSNMPQAALKILTPDNINWIIIP